MDTNAEVITGDGEIIEGGLTVLDAGAASAVVRAEISQQVATAKQYPRSIKRAIANITSLATIDDEAAADCIYALPRGGKPIRGPSIRLAEIVAQQWMNNRVSAQVVEINRIDKVIVAEAIFHDLETNAATRASVRRRATDRQGRMLNDDMLAVTGNAACSIARRNAILAGVPKAVWRKAYEAAEGVVKGDVKTLAERRAKAVAAFGTWGVKPEQLYAVLGVAGEEEVTLEHLPTLIGMFQSIKNGEETVESLFNKAGTGPVAGVQDPLNDRGPAQAPAAPHPDASASSGDFASGASGDGAGASPEEAPAPDQTQDDDFPGADAIAENERQGRSGRGRS